MALTVDPEVSRAWERLRADGDESTAWLLCGYAPGSKTKIELIGEESRPARSPARPHSLARQAGHQAGAMPALEHAAASPPASRRGACFQAVARAVGPPVSLRSPPTR